MSDFATRLKTALANKNMRPSVLAYRLGIDRSTVSNYLNRRYKPKNEITIKIAEILEVSPSWLHGIDETQKGSPAEEHALSDGEKAMIDLFRSASPYQQEMILRMLEAAVIPKE
jgi:transcriptional regulator with XRE-family HTH domain